MKNIDDLLTILQDELLCYKALLELKEKEHALIVSGESENLMQNTQNMKLIIQQVQSLERNRIALMGEIGKDLEAAHSIGTLRSLLPLIPERYRYQLEKVGNQLCKVLEKIKMWNNQNRTTLEQGLDFIANTFRTLVKEASQSDNYSSSGKNQHSSEELVLAVDHRA